MSETAKLAERIAEIDTERTALFEQKRPIDARIVALYEERRALKEQHDKIVFASGEIDWKQAAKDVASDFNSSMTLLRLFDAKVRDLFDMWHSGFWAETSEANIQIKVSRKDDESERKNVEGVRHFAGILTPHEDGFVWFGIFEHSFSRYESLCLKVKPDLSEIMLTALRHNHSAIKRRFATVEEAVKFIRDHHWYGEGGDEAEEEDSP